MNKNDIIAVEIVKNVRIRNLHNDFLFPKQDIINVYFRNGEKRILDLLSQRDFTNIDYFKVENTKNTKVNVLFFEEWGN